MSLVHKKWTDRNRVKNNICKKNKNILWRARTRSDKGFETQIDKKLQMKCT